MITPKEQYLKNRDAINVLLLQAQKESVIPSKSFFKGISSKEWKTARQALHDKPPGAKLDRKRKGVSLQGKDYDGGTSGAKHFSCSFIKGEDGKIYAIESKSDIENKEERQKNYLGRGGFNRTKFAVAQDGSLSVYRVTQSIDTQDKKRSVLPFLGVDGKAYLDHAKVQVSELTQIFYDMAVQLEAERFGHGDVKAENMLITHDSNGKPRATMIDRDLESMVEKGSIMTTYGMVMASDLLDDDDDDDDDELTSSDSPTINRSLNKQQIMDNISHDIKKMDVYALGVSLASGLLGPSLPNSHIRSKFVLMAVPNTLHALTKIVKILTKNEGSGLYPCSATTLNMDDLKELGFEAKYCTQDTLTQLQNQCRRMRGDPALPSLLELSVQMLDATQDITMAEVMGRIKEVNPMVKDCREEAEQTIAAAINRGPDNPLLMNTAEREVYFLAQKVPPVFAENFAQSSSYQALLDKADIVQLKNTLKALSKRSCAVSNKKLKKTTGHKHNDPGTCSTVTSR